MQNKNRSVQDCLNTLNNKIKNATNSDEAFHLEYAKKFIMKHNQDNVLIYKNYFVPVYFNAKNNNIYGRAICRNTPFKFSLIIEASTIEEFIENFHSNVDMIEQLNIEIKQNA